MRMIHVSMDGHNLEADATSSSSSTKPGSQRSREENDFLLELLPSTTTQCWLGNQDAAEEGQWLWSDGTPYDYSNWCSGEPNNLNVENCGELNWASDHCWNDESCSNSMGYVCAKDL
ncbi:ladderlectin-like [Carassius auratus]|uniref:Ladderlectin-like n=1 Tax=Carassius auratus TaxID=7957 RepID=A0A6P6QUY1_CARAU|nr:ladderlectin-like [Carassius auratus]